MTALVMTRTETMPGFNSRIELDEVHTPSRYIALFSYVLLGGPFCYNWFTGFRAFMSRVASCFLFFDGFLPCVPSAKRSATDCLALVVTSQWDPQQHLASAVDMGRTAQDNAQGSSAGRKRLCPQAQDLGLNGQSPTLDRVCFSEDTQKRPRLMAMS
jgi:hypothetical protein